MYKFKKRRPDSTFDKFETLLLPVTQGIQLFTSLQRQKIPSMMLYFPDEDHFVRKPQNAKLWWKTVHEWLEKYLKEVK